MSDRQQLLDWIESGRERIVGFFQDFVRAKSPIHQATRQTRRATSPRFWTVRLDANGT